MKYVGVHYFNPGSDPSPGFKKILFPGQIHVFLIPYIYLLLPL